MKNVLRYLLRFIAVLMVIAVLLIVSCLIFEEQILIKGRDLLAKNLGTEIQTNKLGLDPFAHFPQITLSLEDLIVADNRSQNLLEVESFELLFQPWNIFSDHLDIQTAVLSNGELNLFKTNDKWNYSFGEEDSSSSTGQLSMSQIQLSNVKLNVKNPMDRIDMRMEIKEFLGAVSLDSEMSIAGYLEVIPALVKMDSLEMSSDKPISTQLNIYSNDSEWVVKQMDLETDGIKGNIEGAIGAEMNLKGAIEIIDKSVVEKIIPASFHKVLFNDADYSFEFSGPSDNPDGIISLEANDLKVDLVKKGKAVRTSGKIDVAFFNEYQSTCIFNSGKVVFADVGIDVNTLDIKTIEGALGLRDVTLIYKGKEVRIDIDELTAEKGKFISDKIEMEVENSNLIIDGSFEQVDSSYLLDGKLTSDKIVIKEFLELLQDSSASEEPINVKANLDISIAEMEYEDWIGKAIEGKLGCKKNLVTYDIALESFNGRIVSKGSILQDGQIVINAKSSFNQLNIGELLDQLNNLGQSLVNSKTVKGNLSGHALMDFTLMNDLSINRKASIAKVALRLEKGGLQKFKLLEDFSKYIDVKDLRNVKFDRLTNFFEWKDDHLVLPVLFIKNNAASFLISGYHNMDNEFSYQMQINASEVLAKKFGKKRRGSKRKGWWNMYYSLEGNPDTFIVSAEKARVQKSLQKSLLIKERLFNELTTVFGYDEILDQIEDWKDIPEYDD